MNLRYYFLKVRVIQSPFLPSAPTPPPSLPTKTEPEDLSVAKEPSEWVTLADGADQ